MSMVLVCRSHYGDLMLCFCERRSGDDAMVFVTVTPETEKRAAET
jgi:hypothetical protein